MEMGCEKTPESIIMEMEQKRAPGNVMEWDYAMVRILVKATELEEHIW